MDPTVERKSLALFRLSYTGFWDDLSLEFYNENARTALAVDLWPNNGSKNTYPLITDARFSLMRSMALCSAAFRRCARCDSHGTLVLHIPVSQIASVNSPKRAQNTQIESVVCESFEFARRRNEISRVVDNLN